MGAKTRFHSLLEERLDRAIAERAENILGGGLDPSVYKSETGFINGLRAAKALCEEIEREFD